MKQYTAEDMVRMFLLGLLTSTAFFTWVTLPIQKSNLVFLILLWIATMYVIYKLKDFLEVWKEWKTMKK